MVAWRCYTGLRTKEEDKGANDSERKTKQINLVGSQSNSPFRRSKSPIVYGVIAGPSLVF